MSNEPVTYTDKSLTEDMIASIYLFTSQAMYFPLNYALRSDNGAVVRMFFPFLRLLVSALDRLPNYSGMVYRGIKKDLSPNYTEGCKLSFWSFQSGTTDADSLAKDTFLGRTGTRSVLLLKVTGGKDISAYSADAEEKEILIPAGCTFAVEEILPQDVDLKLFSMRQTKTSDLLTSPARAPGPGEKSKKCCSIQ